MKYLKLLIMASLLSFYGCTGDDDDGGSSSSASAFSCALAEQQLNNGNSFEDLDLGDSVSASCTNGIVSIEAVNTGDAQTVSCLDSEGNDTGDTFDGALSDGGITMDMSQTSVSSNGEISGNVTLTVDMTAVVDTVTVNCKMSATMSASDMFEDESEAVESSSSDEFDPTQIATCTVGTDSFSFESGFNGDCNNADAANAAVAKYLNYFSQLSSFEGEEAE